MCIRDSPAQQFVTVHELLRGVHEKRSNLNVKVVPRRKYRAKRKVIEICQVDLMTGLHLAQQLGLEDQTEEDVDGQHMNEIRETGAKWLPAVGPPVIDHMLRFLRYPKQFEPKSQQPFRFQIVDDCIGHRSRVLERDWRTPGSDGSTHANRHGLQINLLDHLAPSFCDLPFEPEKVVTRPTLHRFFFLGRLNQHALGTPQFHHFAWRKEWAKKYSV